MGVIIPQVITSDRASGAQVIDGSVGISSFSNSHLKRDPGSAGNRKTFSFSGWVKKYNPTLPGAQDDQVIIEARTSSPAADGDIFGVRIEDDGRISVYDYGNFYVRSGAGRMRDTTGWYHVFFSVDTTVASNNVKLYVNNILVGQGTHAQNTDTRFNSTDTHRIGARADGTDDLWLNAAVTNFYVIDGQALEPTDFGYTDPLTNTWRPKKFQTTTRPNNGTTWSSSLSATDPIANASNAFDNSISTYADRASGSSDPNDYTFTPPSTIKAYSSVRMYAYAASGHSNNHFKITYNGGTTLTKTASDLGLGTPGALAWFDLTSYLTFPIDISSFEYRSISGGGQLAAFEIDGVLLVDGLNDTKGFGTNGFYLPMDGN